MQELYGLTVRYLFAVCQRYVVNEEDVRDILQETYIKTFKNIHDFKKKDGYLHSTRLAKEYELYRQDFCGCEFAWRGKGCSL